ncbi:MAG: 23S rRNA (guanosine(2251)-2'-O)-methyltransferase RlmB [Gammaproteobacteria bacterium]|nr:23S rRNA (guanosine(2251)-2'-O)-methyltransferase RlmB [Gammaproteobacteria bacterium]
MSESRITFGIQAVRKALQRGRVTRLFIAEDIGLRRLGRVAEEIARAGVPWKHVADAELQRLTGTDKHQGVAAEVRGGTSLDEHDAAAFLTALPAPLVLALDGIQDPRNFGSLLRTADAAGVDLVVTARSRNVGVTPVVSKVASGAAESQALAEVANLARFLDRMREIGIQTIGTDERASESLYEVDLTGPVALVMGAEGEGLRRLTAERCDRLVQLPMQGVVESLNVAVAAGVCLFECLRQRRLARPPGVG